MPHAMGNQIIIMLKNVIFIGGQRSNIVDDVIQDDLCLARGVCERAGFSQFLVEINVYHLLCVVYWVLDQRALEEVT
jgi:hypothetical protein